MKINKYEIIEWLKIGAAALGLIAMVLAFFWSQNGGQLKIDSCTWSKDPAMCRQYSLTLKKLSTDDGMQISFPENTGRDYTVYAK